MKEQDIIEQGFLHLKEQVGHKIKWKKDLPQKPQQNYDAVFIFNGERIFVEAKTEVRPHQVDRLLQQREKLGNLLLIANYITPNAKELLKKEELNFVDQPGNIWLRIDPVIIHIDGKRNQHTLTNKRSRAFTKAGIKVVLQFLVDPNLVNATYRDIVKVTQVALGTIPKVIEGLKEDGFIIRKTEKEMMINNHEELLQRWQDEYRKRLKPTLFVRKYKPVAADFYTQWKEIDLFDGAVWGGEPAGDLLTNYLKPAVYTLYTNQTQQEIMKKYRWTPDPDGAIEIYKKFWPEKDFKLEQKIAPAEIVYADLMDTQDSRCIETANMIHERHLQKH